MLGIFIEAYVKCEVNIELVRQIIWNKMKIDTKQAFDAIVQQWGRKHFDINDLRVFISKANLYPIEKNLNLLFERFDKNEDDKVDYDEFVDGCTPFFKSELI